MASTRGFFLERAPQNTRPKCSFITTPFKAPPRHTEAFYPPGRTLHPSDWGPGEGSGLLLSSFWPSSYKYRSPSQNWAPHVKSFFSWGCYRTNPFFPYLAFRGSAPPSAKEFPPIFPLHTNFVRTVNTPPLPPSRILTRKSFEDVVPPRTVRV